MMQSFECFFLQRLGQDASSLSLDEIVPPPMSACSGRILLLVNSQPQATRFVLVMEDLLGCNYQNFQLIHKTGLVKSLSFKLGNPFLYQHGKTDY